MIKFVFGVLHVASVLAAMGCETTEECAKWRPGTVCADVKVITGYNSDDPRVCVKESECGLELNIGNESTIKFICNEKGADPKFVGYKCGSEMCVSDWEQCGNIHFKVDFKADSSLNREDEAQ